MNDETTGLLVETILLPDYFKINLFLRGKDSLNDINVIKQKFGKLASFEEATIQKLDNIRKLFTTMRDIRSDSSRNSVILSRFDNLR